MQCLFIVSFFSFLFYVDNCGCLWHIHYQSNQINLHKCKSEVTLQCRNWEMVLKKKTKKQIPENKNELEVNFGAFLSREYITLIWPQRIKRREKNRNTNGWVWWRHTRMFQLPCNCRLCGNAWCVFDCSGEDCGRPGNFDHDYLFPPTERAGKKGLQRFI